MLRVEPRQFGQGFIEGQHINRRVLGRVVNYRERDLLRAVTALFGLFAAGVIHQHAAHHFHDGPEKMGAVLPVNLALPGQTQIRLVHQRGGFKRVVGAFKAQLAGGELAQTLIDQRHQVVQRGLFAVAPLVQEVGNVMGRGLRHLFLLAVSFSPSSCASKCGDT